MELFSIGIDFVFLWLHISFAHWFYSQYSQHPNHSELYLIWKSTLYKQSNLHYVNIIGAKKLLRTRYFLHFSFCNGFVSVSVLTGICVITLDKIQPPLLAGVVPSLSIIRMEFVCAVCRLWQNNAIGLNEIMPFNFTTYKFIIIKSSFLL